LARELREKFPDKIIIAGGLHSYDSSEEICKQPSLDILFKGEAELSLLKYLAIAKENPHFLNRKVLLDEKYISKIKEIKGIIIKTGNEIIDTGVGEYVENLDDLPFSNYDLINLEDYIKTRYDHHAVTNQINFQRGCPYKCRFCKSSVISSLVRSNSAKYMIKQIEKRYDKYNLDTFFLTDSNFTIDKKRLALFCSLMVSSGLSKKIKFIIQTSIAISISDDEIETLRDAGCSMLMVGVERFADDCRKLISKAGTEEQVKNLIKRIHKHGIKTSINIMLNFPFETETIFDRESKALDEIVTYVNFIYINYLSPMPGTSIYENELENIYKKWYLREDVVKYQMTYYDISFLIEGPVSLKLNYFQLNQNMINKIRHFKERYQWKGSMRVSSSFFVKSIVIADMSLGKVSYYVARISPELERLIFYPFKYIRLKGYKVLFNLFVAK
jgi:anaerobic magnesium-protoporphyrin IX monomethyl ester cyclase